MNSTPMKRVTVVSVLAPNRVVVKEKLNVHLNAEYLALEKDLKTSWSTRAKFTDEYKPLPGTHVMVQNRKWDVRRGIVQEELPNRENTQYAVFMYDHGEIDILTTANIAILPSHFKVMLTCRAFIVNIVGIVPSRRFTDLKDMLSGNSARPQYVEGGEWSPAALKFVKTWLMNGENDVLVTVLKSLDNAVKLGDIHRETKGLQQTESLASALEHEKFALFSKYKAGEQVSYEPEYEVGCDNQPISQDNLLSTKASSSSQSKIVTSGSVSKSEEIDPKLMSELNKNSVLLNTLHGVDLENKLKDLSVSSSSDLKDGNKSNEQRKPKRYTAFAPIQEISGPIVTVTNSSQFLKKSNSHRPEYGVCEIPTARRIINGADVPGRTLVRGQDVFRPLESYRSFPFFSHIEKAWDSWKLEEGNELQKAVWPNFAHKQDIFIVGGVKNGKSLSYMMPMCADILANSSKQKVSMKTGPFAMILCSTESSGVKLQGHGHTLLTSNNLNQMNCVFTFENNKEESQSKLRNGAEVLITTVDMAVESQEKFVAHFMFDRLRYLVFDDAHIILKENSEKAMKLLKEFIKFVTKENPTAQLIVCGNEWTPEIEKFYWKLRERPIVHIGSPYEAIVYSGVDLVVHYTPYNSGLVKISEILKNEKDHKKSVVVCGSMESAGFVQLELQNKYKIYSQLAIDIKPENLNSITMHWNNASEEEPQVLICTDEVLKFMKITDATNLIHYEIQDSTVKAEKNRLTVFALRFACMWSHLRDISAEPGSMSWDKRGSFGKKLVSHILLSGKEPDLDKIIKKFKKIDVKIPIPLDQQADSMLASKLEKAPICLGTKMFGWCNNTAMANCNKRHYFIKSDVEKTETLPRTGQVELRVIECLNPSVYSCEIIRYYEMKGNKTIVNYCRKFQEYQTLMEDHYKNMDNRILPDSLKSGTLCGVVLSDGSLARGKVIEVVKRTTTNFPECVRFYCIDKVEKVIRNVNEHIFELPSHIADLPPLCVEVILAGVKPVGSDKEYSDRQKRYARELTEAKIFIGKIVCSIDNTIWVNPLVATKKDVEGKTITDFSVRQDMIHGKKAEANRRHEHILQELCQNANYPMEQFPLAQQLQSDALFTETFFQKGDHYDWAHVPVSTTASPEESLMSIIYVKSPWLLFGNIVKFEKLMDDLIDEINEDTNALIEKTPYCDYYEQFKTIYEIGRVVLALQPSDEKWHRAIITGKEIDEGEAYYDVFFTDFGDTLKNVTTASLFPIKRIFVDRLPFQAIAFNASHITPKEPCQDDRPYASWSEACIDLLFEVFIPDGIAADANVVALSKDPNSESNDVLCRYYCAMLFPKNSTVSDNGDEIGEILFKKGFAEFTRMGKNNLEDVKTALLGKYNELFKKQALDLTDDDDSEGEANYPAISNAPINDGKAYPAGYFDDDFDVYIPSGKEDETMIQLGLKPPVVPPAVPVPTSSNSNSGAAFMLPELVDEQAKASEEKTIVSHPKVFYSSEEPGLKHPKTFWSQTNDEVQLIVELPDISSYTFNLGTNHRTISFRTIKPPNYGFDVDSFGTLEEIPNGEFLTGQYFRVKLKKRIAGHEWKGFHRNYRDVKLPWLKEKLTLDLKEYDDSDDDAPKRDYIPIDYEKMFPESSSDSDENEGMEDFDEDDFEKADVSGMKCPPRPM